MVLPNEPVIGLADVTYLAPNRVEPPQRALDHGHRLDALLKAAAEADPPASAAAIADLTRKAREVSDIVTKMRSATVIRGEFVVEQVDERWYVRLYTAVANAGNLLGANALVYLDDPAVVTHHSAQEIVRSRLQDIQIEQRQANRNPKPERPPEEAAKELEAKLGPDWRSRMLGSRERKEIDEQLKADTAPLLWKDVNQRADGTVLVCTGQNAGLWVSAGRPLRALRWFAKYAVQHPELNPAIRSFLVPLEVFLELSANAIPEGHRTRTDLAAGDPPEVNRSINVDRHMEPNQFGFVGADLHRLASSILPASLVTYMLGGTHDAHHGTLVDVNTLRAELGIPAVGTEPVPNAAIKRANTVYADVWVRVKEDGARRMRSVGFTPKSLDKVVARELATHYATWVQDPANYQGDRHRDLVDRLGGTVDLDEEGAIRALAPLTLGKRLLGKRRTALREFLSRNLGLLLFNTVRSYPTAESALGTMAGQELAPLLAGELSMDLEGWKAMPREDLLDRLGTVEDGRPVLTPGVERWAEGLAEDPRWLEVRWWYVEKILLPWSNQPAIAALLNSIADEIDADLDLPSDARPVRYSPRVAAGV